MNKKALGFYDYTVVLTYIGMLFAFVGILNVIHQNFICAVVCLLFAGICDMFDGAVASTKKDRTDAEKRFGIQIDSCSDLISFGILPALFVYRFCGDSLFIGVVAALFALAALIRLSYFNILEEDRQKQTTEKRKSYLGMPVTTVALLLPLLFLLYEFKLIRSTTLFPILLMCLGTGFLAPVEIKKPGFVGKLIMIALGIAETIEAVLLMGWDLV